MSSKPETLFDRRIVARNINAGRLTRKEFEQYLASLEDATVKTVPLFASAEPDEDPEEE